MPPIERHRSPEVVRGVERSLEVKIAGLGGFELRPTRLFLWAGEDREATERIVSLGREPRSLGGSELRPPRLSLGAGEDRGATERIVSLGREPRSLDIPRHEHELRAGAVEVRTLGNPLMTLALAGVHAIRRLTEEPPAPGGPTSPGSSDRA